MKNSSIVLLVILFCAISGCKKPRSENAKVTTYIAFFQKDSLINFVKPTVLESNPNVRNMLKIYALKILKDNSISEIVFRSSLYSSPTTSGFIVDLTNEKMVSDLKADKRIDSLHKDFAFKGI